MDRTHATDLGIGFDKFATEPLEFPELLHFSFGFVDGGWSGQ